MKERNSFIWRLIPMNIDSSGCDDFLRGGLLSSHDKEELWWWIYTKIVTSRCLRGTHSTSYMQNLLSSFYEESTAQWNMILFTIVLHPESKSFITVMLWLTCWSFIFVWYCLINYDLELKDKFYLKGPWWDTSVYHFIVVDNKEHFWFFYMTLGFHGTVRL